MRGHYQVVGYARWFNRHGRAHYATFCWLSGLDCAEIVRQLPAGRGGLRSVEESAVRKDPDNTTVL
ncbi:MULTISPECIES: hypothetical protein [Acetobacter]|uniref:Uncharacterized protein n=1 Tax=Acetobacter syzygii TaxID=146476 RepID=A0A270BL13_9PROT|nr:hypothetical protein [Acetobacter syzygii]NSL91298.1 hypothetical protein [Acetobacter syzygii]PAL25727.1 hypothetical protein B9K05_08230 [Acetobacter syzygii]PAL25839.1 hypothetical protein B9K04_07725 [Acetobacter syzygii]